MHKTTAILISFVIGLAVVFSSPTQADELSFKTQGIVNNLKNPWSLVFVNEQFGKQEILIAEKRGTLLHIQQSGTKYTTKEITAFQEVSQIGQGGLMDMTLHPQFPKTKLIYYSYTESAPHGKYRTSLGSFKWNEKKKSISEKKTLFRADNLSRNSIHFGSRIVFDKENFLYLCLGDRGEKGESQSLSTHKGKILRLHADGKVPADNPFVKHSTTAAAIYSYGHRNPQGLVYRNGRLWVHEHGPRGGDELNLVLRGKNYGWPVITYGINYSGTKVGKGITSQRGMVQPIVYWVPSIAPSGMILYNNKLLPQYFATNSKQNHFFIGALAHRHLRHVVVENLKVIKQNIFLADLGHRIREVAQDSQGHIYVLTDSSKGQLLKLMPTLKVNTKKNK